MRQVMTTTLVGVAALVAGALVAPQVAVADEPDTPCQADIIVDLDPGVGLQPASGTFTSNGEQGKLVCSGKVQGKAPSGGGTGGADGKYGIDGPNSCAKLDGKTEFTVKATLPSEGGEIKFVDTVIGNYAPLQGNWIFGGAFKGPKSYGIFRFTPTGPDQNCLVGPVKQLAVQADAWVVNGQPDGAMQSRMALPN
jgi:hypothetical protein